MDVLGAGSHADWSDGSDVVAMEGGSFRMRHIMALGLILSMAGCASQPTAKEFLTDGTFVYDVDSSRFYSTSDDDFLKTRMSKHHPRAAKYPKDYTVTDPFLIEARSPESDTQRFLREEIEPTIVNGDIFGISSAKGENRRIEERIYDTKLQQNCYLRAIALMMKRQMEQEK